LAAVAGVTFAQNPNGEPWDKFSIGIGGFSSRTNSEIQLNSETLGLGAVIDLENTLNVERSFDSIRLDTFYRFGETRRHQVELHIFESKRNGDRTLTEDLQIGDKVFPAGSTLHSELDLTFINVDYAYAFFQDDRVRIAVSGGLHSTKVGLKIDTTSGSISESESFTAPLPTVGLRLDVSLAEKWKLRSAANLFYIEYDNFTGGLADTYLGVEWNPFQHVGFGLGYNSITYRVEGDGTASNGLDYNGQINMDINGLLFYARYFF
jgi:hypothetical protein